MAHALVGADVAPAPGDLPAILQQLVDTAKTVLAADGIGLLLADANGQPGSLVTTDAVAELLEQVQQDFGEGPGVAAYTHGEPVAVTDLGADPRWIRLAAVVDQVSVRAVASVPVRMGGVVVGALDAYARTTRAWTPEELGGLEAFAELAAGIMASGVRLDHSQAEVGQLRHALTSRILIEQAKGVLVAREGLDPEAAFQRLRRQARNTARPMADIAGEVIAQAGAGNATAWARAAAGSARRLSELEQVAVGFAAAQTSTTVARLLVDRGLRALDAQAGLVGLNSADGQALELVAWAGYPVQVVTPWRRIPLEAPTPLTEVARNGGAIWLSTTEEFQARYPDVPVVVEHQAHVAIGLVVEGRPAGALGISFLQARTSARSTVASSRRWPAIVPRPWNGSGWLSRPGPPGPSWPPPRPGPSPPNAPPWPPRPTPCGPANRPVTWPRSAPCWPAPPTSKRCWNRWPGWPCPAWATGARSTSSNPTAQPVTTPSHTATPPTPRS